jgi:hypothetical protein
MHAPLLVCLLIVDNKADSVTCDELVRTRAYIRNESLSKPAWCDNKINPHRCCNHLPTYFSPAAL